MEEVCKLKLIDFANVFTPESVQGPSSGEDSDSQCHHMKTTPDEDLIKGVQNLISLLQAMISNPNLLDDIS